MIGAQKVYWRGPQLIFIFTHDDRCVRSREHHTPGFGRRWRNPASRQENSDMEMLGHRYEQIRHERRGRLHRAAWRSHQMHIALTQMLAEMGNESHALRSGEVIIGPQVDHRGLDGFSPLQQEQMIMHQSLNASITLEYK